MKHFKHIFALLLVVALLVSALSISASATYIILIPPLAMAIPDSIKLGKKPEHIKLAIPRLAK